MVRRSAALAFWAMLATTTAPVRAVHAQATVGDSTRTLGSLYLTRRTAVVLLVGAALTGVSAANENPADMSRRLDHPGWERVADVGNLYGDGAMLGVSALALCVVGHYGGDANVRAAGVESVRSLAITYAAVVGLKVATRRTRPDGGAHSFPSGHTAGAFAIAPVLGRHFGPRVAIPAYALALATSIGRLEDRKHYLSDVLFGAALGTSVGLMDGSAGPKSRIVRLMLDHNRVGALVSF